MIVSPQPMVRYNLSKELMETHRVHAAQWREMLRFLLILLLLFLSVQTIKFLFASACCSATLGINGLLQHRQVDYLFIGSSRSLHAYDVRSIEETTGKSAYLLSYNGLQPHLMIDLLEYLLNRRHLKVGMLVLEAYPYNVMQAPELQDTRLFYTAPPALKWQLLQTLWRNGMRLTDLYALTVAEGNEVLLTSCLTRSLIEQRTYNGSYTDKPTPGMPPDRFRVLNEPKEMQTLPPRITLPEQTALVRIFRLARQHRVPLVFMEPPVPLPIMRGKAYTRVRGQLQALGRAHGVPYYALPPQTFDPTDPALFVDPLHTSARGRQLLSHQIIPLLRR